MSHENLWLIISDSHDNIPNVEKFMEIAKNRKVKWIFHLGDIVSPFLAPYFLDNGVEFLGIFGNNDGERLFLIQKFQSKLHNGPYDVQVDNFRIFMMHEPYALLPAVKSQLYDFVFYGHTHRLDTYQEGKTLVINPGESCGYLTGRATAVILDPKTKEYEIVKI
ncbi:MAG: metallophosphoesterase [Fervidobacterium sp.]|jgi:putative phosphoesterase